MLITREQLEERLKEARQKNVPPQLYGIQLENANLTGVNFSKANLHGANLRHSNLCEANFSGADLSNAQLSGCNLRYANFTKADLTFASVDWADLSYDNLDGAHFINVSALEAKFTNARPRMWKSAVLEWLVFFATMAWFALMAGIRIG